MKILYGGLTEAHNILIKGAMENLGYEVEPLPTPDNEALEIGKRFCNKGQCNPTYYTVGTSSNTSSKRGRIGRNSRGSISSSP